MCFSWVFIAVKFHVPKFQTFCEKVNSEIFHGPFKGQMQQNWTYFDLVKIRDSNPNNHNLKFYMI